MKAAVVLALAGAALSAPTPTIESRELPGSGTGGLDALKSVIPQLGQGASGLPSLPHFSGFPHLDGLPGLPSDLPSISDLIEKDIKEIQEKGASKTDKRQLPGLSALESLIPSSSSGSGSGLSSLLSGLGGSSGGGGLSALESLIPSAGSSSGSSGLSGLSSLFPGLGGSSGSSTGGLSALESLIPSAGSSGSGGLSSLLSGGGLGRREAEEVEKRQLGGMTANDVTSKAACKELTFIFARGTTEPGNMGAVVGPEVATQLKSLTGNKVAVQGVTYPASVAGNAQMGAAGGPTMAKLVKQALSQCPNTKVVVGGYSQGSMVVHNAAKSLSAGQISGAVLFGDPFKAQAVAHLSNDKRKEFCAVGDPVCENGFNVMAHITYGSDAKTAAQFLVKAAGVA
ncbi:unnamed protein product [Penicillium salamii]|uniref:Cutinase n=1 Tax=Penicillium salamii TaxID=1612424 RepID=A0A9W4INT3_9EURO|nr:unnamed protein product [Penicillium salamii]CAG8231509.1 unnamed protein product [Penicillium salamii]CAG8281841.1 unnamed protein product [Penicillium salamii]CAG8293683.1 unnamed protein product [Penicillium salamii]CAG8309937.1 unnamed protein product [Penicillium salamii]